ncbi:unnamed protein product, partial [Ixodes pacificus]
SAEPSAEELALLPFMGGRLLGRTASDLRSEPEPGVAASTLSAGVVAGGSPPGSAFDASSGTAPALPVEEVGKGGRLRKCRRPTASSPGFPCGLSQILPSCSFTDAGRTTARGLAAGGAALSCRGRRGRDVP